jgi:hypothetical protein
MSATLPDTFLAEYLQMWNEPDPLVRRRLVESLWSPDAVNATPGLRAQGHDEIEARVTRSYDTFVGAGGHRFETHEPAVAHHGAMRVWWRMVAPDGTVAATGQEFLVLDGTGRIVSDHQFPMPA